MNEAQKYLLENNLNDIVLNTEQYPENTLENSKKWIYLSDVLEQYLQSELKNKYWEKPKKIELDLESMASSEVNLNCNIKELEK